MKHCLIHKSLFTILSIGSLASAQAPEGWQKTAEFPYLRKSTRTVSSPKSVNFSPDGQRVVVTSLGENRIDVVDANTVKKIDMIQAPGPAPANKECQGFPEGDFLPATGDFWFSRMASGTFYVHNFASKKTEGPYNACGQWTKVVRFSPDFKHIAFAHWESHNVTVFDVESRKLVASLQAEEIARGIAWIDNSRFATAIFGDENHQKQKGGIEVFDIESKQRVASLAVPHGTRDIKYDDSKKMLYFSNMRTDTMYKYDWEKNEVIATLKVDEKPNTIQLSPDGRFLYVSCRGPNNKAGYEKRSPRNGFLFKIDTEKFEVVQKWEGGNQPTGLALSPDGKFLAATDFMDDRLTIYKVEE